MLLVGAGLDTWLDPGTKTRSQSVSVARFLQQPAGPVAQPQHRSRCSPGLLVLAHVALTEQQQFMQGVKSPSESCCLCHLLSLSLKTFPLSCRVRANFRMNEK